MPNLYDASNQWQTRPADERFWTVQELLDATMADRRLLREATTRAALLQVLPEAGELNLIGPQGKHAKITYGGLDKVCRLVEAPASYIRTLPPRVAAEALTHGLAVRGSLETKLLLRNGGSDLQVRDASGESYERIYAAEVAARLLMLEEQGWKVPPARPAMDDPRARPATEADVVRCAHAGMGIKVGDQIAPAGLYYGYSSSSTLFAFMVDDTRPIDAGGGRQLYKGFFVDSPELSGASLKITWFLFDAVCGNHIVWGVDSVVRVRVRHVGSAADRAWAELSLAAEKFSQGSGESTEEKIRTARATILGETREEVIDRLFGLKLETRKILDRAYTLAELGAGAYGDPRSVWGMVSGLTEASQEQPWIEARTAIDQAAGKVLELAF